ncbi:Pseudo-response regulator 9 [Heracleum sosnowskyi]|uniref:Pseudo-response regulator 9 n=1 Tax=Heracleum sosnowskyi TaxID=360622 RepID=A0AAD8HHM6_9APIA|nr:Pseudo-response regulator 9 [Heracleum sosnowskyi]
MIKVKERVVGSRETEMKNAEEMKEEEEEEDNVMLRWEKFVDKMEMRVLLVEADDSTRHIITALLKKCGYKVDSASDGLKAWEILNRRSHNIDLILTEVEVPSISGFSLLSLVAVHEVCRNIPVIMMSAHDSVSTVYNCMLKGAADFLLKPIRKNELNNLWQHVWRRQASSSGQAHTASDAQQMVEVAAEKDAIKDYSSEYEACCIERNRECIQKGSDSQSSCRLQDSETKKAYPKHKYDITQVKQRKSPSRDVIIQKDEHEKGSEQALMHDGQDQGSMSVPKTDSEVLMLKEDTAADSQCKHAIVTTETFDYDNIVQDKASREAIDLIGTFSNYPECNHRSLNSTYGLNKIDSSFLLELSLNLSHPRGSLNPVMDDGRMLKQSEASAFSRYNGRTLQPLHKSSDRICDQQRGYETSFDKQLTHQVHEHSSGLVKCASFEGVCNVYNNLAPPLFCTQSSQSPLQSPDTCGNHERSIQLDKNHPVNLGIGNSQKILKYLMDKNVYTASTLMEHNKSYGSELSKDQVHLHSVSSQHGSGGSCNGISNRVSSTNNGSNGTSHAFELVKVAAEDENEANIIHNEKLSRSIQREAALAKFRMKRKERCFDKKVRYQSRSKLAVQRPRVKGQFVLSVVIEPHGSQIHKLGIVYSQSKTLNLFQPKLRYLHPAMFRQQGPI